MDYKYPHAYPGSHVNQQYLPDELKHRVYFEASMNGNDKFEKEDENIDTLGLLDKKLKESIINEKYEDAAKIRDLINNIKEDREKENNK